MKDNDDESIFALFIFTFSISVPFLLKWDTPEDKLLCYSETSIDGSDVDLKSQSSGDLPSVA